MRKFMHQTSLTKLILALITGVFLSAAVLAGVAKAGVATSGAVLLDPFDPVPEIQFYHFGGYGGWGCGYGCGHDCHEGCYGHHHCEHDCYRRAECNSGCYHHEGCEHDRCDHHARCDDDCDGHAFACDQANCSDAEHYERSWRNGDRVGLEWFDRGREERILLGSPHPDDWDGYFNYWRDHGDGHHDDHGDGHHDDHGHDPH